MVSKIGLEIDIKINTVSQLVGLLQNENTSNRVI
jgi:hypothetical protein